MKIYKFTFLASLYSVCLLFLALEFSIQLIATLGIVGVYVIYRPKYFFHPNNVIFGYYFLYVVIPSNIDFFLEGNKIWGGLSQLTHIHYLSTFIMYFFAVHLAVSFLEGNGRYKLQNRGTNKGVDINCGDGEFQIGNLFIIVVACLFYSLMAAFVFKTGGVGAWLSGYKLMYLTGRAGLGVYSILIMVVSNLLVFLLGVRFYRLQDRRWFYFIVVLMFVILPVAYLQGMKSRLIYLLIIFFSPYLLHTPISIKKGVGIFGAFVIIFFVGNYIRSAGYYSSVSLFVSYLPQYFNTYVLHDMLINDSGPGFFQTIFWTFKKPVEMMGFDSGFEYAALSNWLSAKYFPDQWFSLFATQQWPIESEIYLNYGFFGFGAIAIILYSSYLSVLYYFACREMHAPILFLYFYEFLRFFSSFRGTMFEWQMWVYIPLYSFIAFLLYRFSKGYRLNG